MANITIVKLKVRRGSDTQRKTIVLDQGEIGYTLDTRRLFVGDGATYGGQSVGTKNIGPFSSDSSLGPNSSPGMQIGDIGYSNNRLYILSSTNYNDSLSGYAYIGNVPDDTFIEFDSDNKLTLKLRSLDTQYLKSEFFGEGLLSAAGGVANVSLNADYLEISGSAISPIANSITEREIKNTALSSGLVGGNNSPIKLSIDTDQFVFDNDNRLSIKSVGSITLPVSSWAGQDGDNLVGSGLSLNSITNNLQSDIRSINVNTFTLDDGQLSLFGATSSAQEFPFLTTKDGLIKEINTSIFDVVTGLTLSGNNTSSSIPIGTILPHARAWVDNVPDGFLLANGRYLSKTTYADLFNVIGTSYGDGDGGGTTFSLPNLTGGGMPATLYGHGALAPNTDDFSSGNQKFLTGDTSSSGAILSGFGVNYIIKYKDDAISSLFNGAPDSISIGAEGRNNNQVYHGTDSTGAAVMLSSAGFITFALSGDVRNPDSDGSFDKFAIPVFNY